MNIFKAILGGKRSWRLRRYQRRVAAINALEPLLRSKSDEDLRAAARELRGRVKQGAALDDLLVEAFAVGREAAHRTLGLRPFDVQLIGGMALHEGLVVEMKTGEGKTLAATLPAFLNALKAQGVHVVTVNDYLAQRDAQWMEPLYEFLGLTVGVVLEEMGQDPQEELQNRQQAYGCDITYGTNHEIAFDYLRDNLATVPGEMVQRDFAYAIVDEVDFLLIDEARTPLIISGPLREDQGFFERVDQVIRRLLEGRHFKVDARTRTVALTEEGFNAVQQGLGVSNLARMEHLDLYHAVHQSVLAHGLYRRDVDYVVEEDQVFIVDEFTGRVSEDKRYANGLHQAIEAKEGVAIKSEDQTLAKVTYQTFFGRYQKLAGMTGTAWSERQEFLQTYGRDAQVIPTHKPMIREDFGDTVYDTLGEKHEAIVEQILGLRERGRPVLVGTTSVQESEQLSELLHWAGATHSVLNAKNHRAEAGIIAQAGRSRAITVSTNMAGRGTDIVLGGNPEMMAKQQGTEGPPLEELQRVCSRDREEVVAAGGLHVIGTAHHEAVRIDDQLRGRAGRQGDPGSSQFIVSLDDDIWKKFGKTDLAHIRDRLQSQGHQQGQEVGSPAVLRTLRALQKKVDVENQAMRRDVLKYDLVVHVQRETIYGWRRTLVSGEGYDPQEIIREVVDDLCQQHPDHGVLSQALGAVFHAPFDLPKGGRGDQTEATERALALLRQREDAMGQDVIRELGRQLLLQAIDELWTEHLSALERVEEGIGLRGYAQVDPVLEWRREATVMWEELLQMIRQRAIHLWFLVEIPL